MQVQSLLSPLQLLERSSVEVETFYDAGRVNQLYHNMSKCNSQCHKCRPIAHIPQQDCLWSGILDNRVRIGSRTANELQNYRKFRSLAYIQRGLPKSFTVCTFKHYISMQDLIRRRHSGTHIWRNRNGCPNCLQFWDLFL